MSGVPLRFVGAVDLVDLAVIAAGMGWDRLPYPFAFTQRNRFATAVESEAHAATVRDRLQHGDLRTMHRPLDDYGTADIRVWCTVQYIPADRSTVRVLAYRAGDRGVLAIQQSDQDVIDLYTLSPYDLGAAIAQSAALDGPGSESRVVVPRYGAVARGRFDRGGVAVRDVVTSSNDAVVEQDLVSAYATVQSDWRPTPRWAPDQDKPMVVWLHVDDDGDYVFEPDRSSARPLTERLLAERIDELIAEDVWEVRQMRGA